MQFLLKLKLHERTVCVQNNERRNGKEVNSCPPLINSARSATPAVLEILSCQEDLARLLEKSRYFKELSIIVAFNYRALISPSVCIIVVITRASHREGTIVRLAHKQL